MARRGTISAYNPALFAHMVQHEATWNTAAVVLGLDSKIKQGRGWIARGWPDKLSYGMVARLQHPREPDRENALRFGLMRDCIQNKIPHHRPARLVIVQGELRMTDPIQPIYSTPVPESDKQHAFKIDWNAMRDWLAQHSIEPSELLTAWFAANGAQSLFKLGNANAEATPPAPSENSISSPTAWTVRRPQRFRGYGEPLYLLLAAAYREGRPRPTARDVLEAWRNNKPAALAKVLQDGFDYYDAGGDTKPANLEAIRKAIGRMTSAR